MILILRQTVTDSRSNGVSESTVHAGRAADVYFSPFLYVCPRQSVDLSIIDDPCYNSFAASCT